MKFSPDALASSSYASLRSVSPFPGSSPIDSSPTRGSAMPKRCRAYTAPMSANCTSHSACTSELAPASSRIVGVEPGTGIGVAIAGRFTPEIRPIRSSADAIVAPVLPAEIMALALPSRTASAARTSVESFLRRTPCAGSSCIPITSDASISSSSMPVRGSRQSRPLGPTRTTGVPALAARNAPATIGPGASSPPMASTAIGSMRGLTVSLDRMVVGGRSGSADVDDDAVAVPTARTTHGVRNFGGPTARAQAARRRAQTPRTRTTATCLRLRCLLLGNGHRSLSSFM